MHKCCSYLHREITNRLLILWSCVFKQPRASADSGYRNQVRGSGFCPYYGAKSSEFNSHSAYLGIKPWEGEKPSVPLLLQCSQDTEHCSLFLATKNGSVPVGLQLQNCAWFLADLGGKLGFLQCISPVTGLFNIGTALTPTLSTEWQYSMVYWQLRYPAGTMQH